MAKLLIYGNPESPLVRERGLIGQEAGHRLYWVSARKARFPGIRAFGLPNFAGNSFLLRAFLEPLLVRHVLRIVQPDLVHVHYASKGLAALALRGKFSLLVSVMGSDIMPEAGYRGWYATFTRLLLDRADVITSKSSYMDAVLQSIGDYKDKVRRIRWGVDLGVFHPRRDTAAFRKRWDIISGALVFFDPRSAKALYNKEIILEAFHEYRLANSPPAVLLIATSSAEPSYLAFLQRRARELNLGKAVSFLPPLSTDEMADAFCLADVTISVPRSDGLPQSLLEAMACGSHLLLGNLPQYAEIVRGGASVQVLQSLDPQKMAEALLWFADRPEVRATAKEINPRYVEKNANLIHEKRRLLDLYGFLLTEKNLT
ncbi:MAG: glycosyltransferase [Anaerolineales bacterium]